MEKTRTLGEVDWHSLLRSIKDGQCTPFLGAGACFGVLPLGAEIAQEWAEEYGYPLKDSRDLIRVAQFLAIERDPIFTKEEILERFFRDVAPPDFKEPDEPHRVLADLPLPIYMTTNYDDFMVEALKSWAKDPKRELCYWNEYLKDLRKDQPSIFDSEPGFDPTPENPVVFHLHGHNEVPESLVLTEDDYLEFLANASSDQALLPPRIRQALATTTLLFVGYRLADWNFRVLFQRRQRMRYTKSILVLPPPEGQLSGEKVLAYLDRYYADMDIVVYWGTAREFAAELRQRREQSL